MSVRPNEAGPREASCHTQASRPQPSQAEEPAEGGTSETLRLQGELRDARQAIVELTAAVAARDTFIAIAGHELRNPMGGIVLGVGYMLHQARSGNAPPWLLPRLEALDRQSRSFVRRAITLLDVSRIASGNLKLDVTEVVLTDLVREIVEDLRPEAQLAGCALTFEGAPAVTGRWDRTALEQVAFNFISNAIKYGSGRPVHVSLACDETTVRLGVRDHGAGISEADRRRIFERFERAVQRGAHGFGLGLWIAERLVRAHGGEILVESEPGAGSLFTARLPRGIPDPHR